MTSVRLVLANMIWYIKYVMEQNGFKPADYDVIYSYPNVTKVEKYPTIAVDRQSVRKEHFEIGGVDRTKVSLVIDVLCNSAGQKEDISSTLQDYFHERDLTLYDFTTLFPTVVGDYTGIPSRGMFYIESVSVVTLHPPQFSNVPAEKFHDMLIMDVLYRV